MTTEATPGALGSNAGLGPAPRWWHYDTHGPGTLTAWGCPECVREMRDENKRLRDCLAQAVKAIEWQEGKRPHNLTTIGRAYWRARWLLGPNVALSRHARPQED